MEKDIEKLPSTGDLLEMYKHYVDIVSTQPFGIVKPGNGKRVIIERSEDDGAAAMDELMAMTGLDEVKSAVNQQLAYHRIMSLRSKFGCKMPPKLLHTLLLGNPGTGKSTVARLLSRIYKAHGIVSSGHIIEVSRMNLVGEYIGHTEARMKELIASAKGGLLFIDEIYSLVVNEGVGGSTDNKDFGIRVIDSLVPVLSDPHSDLVVIGAGYPAEMRRFLSANSGLASRFPIILEFKDPTIDELMQIALNHLSKYQFNLTLEAEAKLKNLISEASHINNFGCARFVLNLIDNHLIPNLCQRLDRSVEEICDIDELSTITTKDVPSDISVVLPLMTPQREKVGFRGN